MRRCSSDVRSRARTRLRRAPLALLVGALALALFAFACSDDDGAAPDGEATVRVVVTTPLLAEFTTIVAADAPEGAVQVEALVPKGVDLHTFQASPDVVRSVAAADLLIVNGYNLEEGILDVIAENRRSETPVLVAADPDGAATAEEAGLPETATSHEDPHRWLDVQLAVGYVDRIAAALATVDTDRASGYERAAEAYRVELEAVDQELRTAAEAVAQQQRTLVVFHDAYSFFAKAYGFELVGAVHDHHGHGTSASDVAAVVETIRERGIGMVFRELQFDDDAIQLVAEETGAQVATLYSIPIPGAADSYVEMMRRNVLALTALATGVVPEDPEYDGELHAHDDDDDHVHDDDDHAPDDAG